MAWEEGLVYPAQGHVRRRRLALWVWYRGDRFQGWQSQRTGRSVQETLVGGTGDPRCLGPSPWPRVAPTAASTPAASR